MHILKNQKERKFIISCKSVGEYYKMDEAFQEIMNQANKKMEYKRFVEVVSDIKAGSG